VREVAARHSGEEGAGRGPGGTENREGEAGDVEGASGKVRQRVLEVMGSH
jgi:hypothetical protein